MADRAGFEEFVAARSPRLLRVCYLLTRDWASAEDLLQTSLAKAWFAWDAWRRSRRRTWGRSSPTPTPRTAGVDGARRLTVSVRPGTGYVRLALHRPVISGS